MMESKPITIKFDKDPHGDLGYISQELTRQLCMSSIRVRHNGGERGFVADLRQPMCGGVLTDLGHLVMTTPTTGVYTPNPEYGIDYDSGNGWRRDAA